MQCGSGVGNCSNERSGVLYSQTQTAYESIINKAFSNQTKPITGSRAIFHSGAEAAANKIFVAIRTMESSHPARLKT